MLSICSSACHWLKAGSSPSSCAHCSATYSSSSLVRRKVSCTRLLDFLSRVLDFSVSNMTSPERRLHFLVNLRAYLICLFCGFGLM